MLQTADALGREQLLDVMSDWHQRIADGETPPAPPRPSGIERNLVITQWAWGDAFTYAHDEVATDKRDPTRYANQPIYGVDLGNDRVLVLDPIAHKVSSRAVPTADGFDTAWCNQTYKPMNGTQAIPAGFGSLGCPARQGITGYEGQYPNPANPHNPMLDERGKLWITTQIRRQWAQDLPSFCKDDPVIANNFHHRQLGWFDTQTATYQLIDTCFGTHHLQFDHNGILWTSGDSYVIGWFDPSRYDPARPESVAQAQGWSEIVIDSDGDGIADEALVDFNYGVTPNPVDGSVWVVQPGGHPGGPLEYRGRLIRYDPAIDRHEVFVPPKPGAGPRGVDVDSEGVIWVALGGSGHLAKFDRRLCSQLWGRGDQCPQGWTLYRSPGPLMRTGSDPGAERAADFHYYLFVDRFNTLGLGEDIVVMNGTGSDSLLAFDPNTEQFTVIRIPYPLNTFTRGLDGRIDDPAAGWKGRALWFTNGLDPILHSEIPQSYVGKIQLRPHPLAR
jgi:streptogramin lyase